MSKIRTLQLYRGDEASLPALASGEPAWTDDTRRLFVGSNGTAAGNRSMGSDGPVESPTCIGTRTVPEMNALSPFVGMCCVAGSAGTPTAGSSDTFAIGDGAEYDGTQWKKIWSNDGGYPPVNTGVLVAPVAVTIYSPFTNGTDHAKGAIYDGTSLTPALFALPSGSAVSVGNTVSQLASRQYHMEGAPPSGSWALTNVRDADLGAGLERNPANLGTVTLKASDAAGNGLDAATATSLAVDAADDSLDVSVSGVKVQLDGALADRTSGANADNPLVLTASQGLNVARDEESLTTDANGALELKLDGDTLAVGASGVRVERFVNAVIAVADAGSGATAAALTLDAKDPDGSAFSGTVCMMITASDTQYAGLLDPNANITLDTVSKGSVLASSAAAGWWVILTDSSGQFACNANNTSDEQVWFCAENAHGGVDALTSGATIRACVPDSATWSA